MNFKGFQLNHRDDGLQLEVLMPEELRDCFTARLYARGPLNDCCDGDPEKLWKRLAPQYGDRELIAPKQVHKTHILNAAEAKKLPEREEADGIFLTAGEPAMVSLRFADCAPVVICGAGEIPWLMLLHSGFKGTLTNIAAEAITYAISKIPAQQLNNIYAWIGPAIGFECYSRSAEDPTTLQAKESFAPENQRAEKDYIFFNIKGQIMKQLLEKGLIYDKIFLYDCCTFCRRDLFYSYRAGDGGSRLFLAAGAKNNLKL